MRLLDSNIVIYAVQPAHEWLRTEITSQSYAISQASRVEVLGWHQITTEDKADLEEFLSTGTLLSISDAVADKAVALRQQKKMSLGDSFIAATALVHGCELLTRNTDDFKHIPGLLLSNPFGEE
jgi:predicted nucleic acid-binding protein